MPSSTTRASSPSPAMRHTTSKLLSNVVALALLALLSLFAAPTATHAQYTPVGPSPTPPPTQPTSPSPTAFPVPTAMPTMHLMGADGSSPSATSTTWQLQQYSPLSVPQGDGVLFQWSGIDHSVVRLMNSTCPESGDNSTILEMLVPEASSGSYTFSTASFAPGSTVYLACSVPTHCSLGMLLQINVKGSTSSSQPRAATASLSWAMAAAALAVVSAA